MNSLRLGINSLGSASTGGLTKAALISRLKAVEIGALACYLPSEYATTAWKQYNANGERAAVGFGVGFLGDIMQGMDLGEELVINGNFSSGLSGWTSVGATLSIENGQLKITNTISGHGYATQERLPAVNGSFFKVGADLASGTGTADIFLGYGIPAVGGSSFISRGSYTSVVYRCRNYGDIGTYSYFDNNSLRLLAGNHSIQPTESARPTLRYSGGLYYLDPTSGQGLTAYLPASVGETVTVVYANPGVGAVIVTGVAVTSQSLPLPYKHSGLVIMPSTASTEAVAAVAAMVDVLARRVVV